MVPGYSFIPPLEGAVFLVLHGRPCSSCWVSELLPSSIRHRWAMVAWDNVCSMLEYDRSYLCYKNNRSDGYGCFGGMTHDNSRPGGPSWSPATAARRPLPSRRGRHRSRRRGRGAPAAARAPAVRGDACPAPRGRRGRAGGGRAAGEGREGCDVPGAAVGAARRGREPGAALPAFVWPRRGPAPAQVRPRRPGPRPPVGRGLVRPGPPRGSPPAVAAEPARSCQGECPARPGGAAPAEPHRRRRSFRPSGGGGGQKQCRAGGLHRRCRPAAAPSPGRGLLLVACRRCRRGTGNLSGLQRAGEVGQPAAGEGGGRHVGLRAGSRRRSVQKRRGALLEGAGEGGGEKAVPCWRVLPSEKEGAGGRSWGVMSPRELSFISSSGHLFKEHYMSLSMPELCKRLEGWGSLQLISTALLTSFTRAGHP